MNKKCILHILNSNTFSGAENVAITIIKQMTVKHPEYEYIYVSPYGKINEVLKKNNIKYVPLKKLTYSELKKVFKKYNPCIVHAHDFRATVISSLLVDKKIKLISHIHNNNPWLKNYCIKSIAYLFANKKCFSILAVSKSVFDEYVFKKYINNKVFIINNPIDINLIKEKAKLNVIDKKYDVIFIGRYTLPKDPLRFLNIVKKTKEKKQNISVAMLGSGELYDKCNEFVRNNSLSGSVEMFGFVDNPYCILKNSKVLCMTSRWEGYGLVAVEALALGKPVVATKVGGIPNIVDNNCGKLCNSDNEFIDEILKLLSDNDYYKFKSSKAIEKAQKLHNIDDYIKNLYNIYTK